MDRLFLDGNVLFSSAYGPTAPMRALRSLTDARLLTSGYAIREARKGPRRVAPQSTLLDLAMLLERVETVPIPHPVDDLTLPSTIVLHDKDRPILLAAIGCGASHLLTGDNRHFGAYFGQLVLGGLILEPGVYLRTRRP